MSRTLSFEEHRKLRAVRIAGVIFLIAASVVFFFGMGGGHSHGELYVAGAEGAAEVRVPGSKGGQGGEEPVVAAGALRFRLANPGSADHQFAVFEESEDGEVFAGLAFAGMDADGPSLDLAPGHYRIVCTTPGHESQGMSYELRVE